MACLLESSGVRELEDHLHVELAAFDVETGRLRSTIDVFSIEDDGYDHLETMAFEPRLYAPVELREMCDRAGFDEVSLFGDFEGDSLDSPSVVTLAR